MKKLIVMLIATIFIAKMNAEVSATALAKAAIKESTHWCQCGNGSLETINCHKQCGRSGWTGKVEYVPGGVRCLCNSGDNETVMCESKVPKRCMPKYLGGSGFSGEVYSMSDKKFHKVPTK